MAQSHFPPGWKTRLLAVLNSSRVVDQEVIRLLDAWAQAEGGNAQWNPLNTTYYLAGATDYNDAKVRNYRYPIDGICATALTLCGRDSGVLRYPGILGALQSGTLTAPQIVTQNAVEFTKWGTRPETILAVLGV